MSGIPSLDTFTNDNSFVELFADDLRRLTGSMATIRQAPAIFSREPGEDWIEPEPEIDFDHEIEELARVLAEEANWELVASKVIYRTVIDHGGIDRKRCDYESIPAKYLRKNGSAFDDLASEIGMNDSELYARICTETEIAGRLPVNTAGKKARKFRAKDFLGEAEMCIIEKHGRSDNEYEKVPF